ncbi:MAG: hypothetical protein FWC91_13080 [Defluviitaleaceae bacterium]|nr:hypothetical protein [Defluviitaleaceae bacterium]
MDPKQAFSEIFSEKENFIDLYAFCCGCDNIHEEIYEDCNARIRVEYYFPDAISVYSVKSFSPIRASSSIDFRNYLAFFDDDGVLSVHYFITSRPAPEELRNTVHLLSKYYQSRRVDLIFLLRLNSLAIAAVAVFLLIRLSIRLVRG